ncbi:MAG: zinc ABC transporter substrate-binding protein [Verrucomicrobiaceae bacterium]|nr:MAG: zinc ABC transporter substrate-binding protein [Verrucomicrobiaceae bacterium]
MELSPKQEVYFEMLRRTLLHLRSIAEQSWWRRLQDRSAYYETELIHNLPVSLFEPEFVAHDIWFLNVQARSYCAECNPQISGLYLQQTKLIRELISLVPGHLRDKLEWAGPGEFPNPNA